MILIDDKNFYPTPEPLIYKMISDINFDMDLTILEPSAGTGNIAEAIRRKLSSRKEEDIDCIEIEETLRLILKGKNFRVVHDDFLTFNTRKQYDLIIMNPPFDTGDKHLLKALQMQEQGGKIVCLLNAETLRNCFSNTRKELATKLKDYNASIEFIQNAFIDAERKTYVEVALIKIDIPKEELVSKFFTEMEKAHNYSEVELPSSGDSELMNTDLTSFFQSIVNQYRIEVDAGIRLIKEYAAMQPYLLKELSKGENPYASHILELSVSNIKYSKGIINDFCRKVRLKYWNAVMDNSKFNSKLTTNVRSEFYNKIDKLQDYEFSVFNIFELFAEMRKSIKAGIEDTIIKLFDEMSSKYSYFDETSNNVHYYNGWKTNKSWKINKKVILPFYGKSEYHRCGFDIYRAKEKIRDLVKTLDYLDNGVTSDDIYSPDYKIEFSLKNNVTKNIEVKHLEVTFYKKGTLHIKFTNDTLLEKFNLFCGLNKKMLPPNYGRKHYKDMPEDEQAVVREFSGTVENYESIVSNQQYYLTNKTHLALY